MNFLIKCKRCQSFRIVFIRDGGAVKLKCLKCKTEELIAPVEKEKKDVQA